MHLTKRELRQLPLHALLDLAEATYLLWRFEDRNSALEGSLAVYCDRIFQEVNRRRRRAISSSCTCEVCWLFSAAFAEEQLR
jgi:hypothetical protein